MMRIGLELSNEEEAFFTIKFKDGDQHGTLSVQEIEVRIKPLIIFLPSSYGDKVDTNKFLLTYYIKHAQGACIIR